MAHCKMNEAGKVPNESEKELGRLMHSLLALFRIPLEELVPDSKLKSYTYLQKYLKSAVNRNYEFTISGMSARPESTDRIEKKD